MGCRLSPLRRSYDSLQQEQAGSQRFLYHTQETSGEEGDKITFHTRIPHTERHRRRNVDAILSWQNSQLAGCSPNRRMSWSCVNLTKVSYCSEVERTGTHNYFWLRSILEPRGQHSKPSLFWFSTDSCLWFTAQVRPLLKTNIKYLTVVKNSYFKTDLFKGR